MERFMYMLPIPLNSRLKRHILGVYNWITAIGFTASFLQQESRSGGILLTATSSLWLNQCVDWHPGAVCYPHAKALSCCSCSLFWPHFQFPSWLTKSGANWEISLLQCVLLGISRIRNHVFSPFFKVYLPKADWHSAQNYFHLLGKFSIS